MRIFKNHWFARFASKEGIHDSELKDMVSDVLETGHADANLGGNVYKVRLARPGEGKSGGFRIIVFFKIREKTFFHYGFSKSAKDNISKEELKIMKKLAKELFAQSDQQINMQLIKGTLLEII